MGTSSPADFGTNQDHFSALLAAGIMLMDDEDPEGAAVNALLGLLAEVVGGVPFDAGRIYSPCGDELDEFLVWAENSEAADNRTLELVRLLWRTAI